MATIDVGSGNKRELNRELPLIPFIDFLLCLISFLLITAVWSQLARLEANAQVPGQEGIRTTEQTKQLHVHVEEHRFDLVWRQGGTVVASSSVKRQAVPSGHQGDVTYPALAQRLEEEWIANGVHRDDSDRRQDLAVLHASNATEFADLVAVMDAISAPQRELGQSRKKVAAFSVSFAVD